MHPLVIHFPIALVIVALAAEAVSGADRGSPDRLWLYRIALTGAALLVMAAGHLGGLMVWGADFLRP